MRATAARYVVRKLRMLGPPPAREKKPSLDHRIGIERDGVDALLHQPLCKIRMVRRSLAADADVFAGLATCSDRQVQHRLDRGIALVERTGDDARIAVYAERELRHVVRADR